ncbi:family 16 glycoside hydrolase [Fibrobacterota bacterium]
MNIRNIIPLTGILCLLPALLCGQTFTKEDSGWVSLFNGEDYEGLYIRLGGDLKNPSSQSAYEISGGLLSATGSSNGYIATTEVYSNYEVRVEYQFGTSVDPRNAGLLYHIPDADYQDGDAWETSSPVSRLNTNWPTCIEFQMYNGGGASGIGAVGPHAGAFLGIVNVWGSSTVDEDMSCAYDENGTPFELTLGGLYCERRVGPAPRDELNDYDNWVQAHLISVSNTVEHYIDGVLAAIVWDIEFDDQSSPTRGPMVSGHLGLQSEGHAISYRNFEIRMLDEQGDAIIPGCTNQDATNYVPFATVDDGSCETTALETGRPAGNFGLAAAVRGGQVEIRYSVPFVAKGARLELSGVDGRVYKSFAVRDAQGAAVWNLDNVTPGIVSIRLSSGKHIYSAKAVVLK